MAYKMAIVGYGGMASWHHENIEKNIPQIKVTGIYDIREEAEDKAKKKGLHVYKNPEELYNDKEIDLVLVATPNDSHITYSINLLKSGKNVVCEKPVTLNKKELEKIIKVSEESGKFFTVHQNRRWDSDYLTLKNIFEKKILSEPYIIESRVQGSRRSLHGWRGYKVNGGGMVLDWGVHLIDQMLDFTDSKVVAVNAHLHKVFAPEVDDAFTAEIRFENGLNYMINIDMNCFILQPRWHVSSVNGTAVIQNWELDGKIVKLASDEDLGWAEDIVYTAAGPTRSMAPRPKETTEEIELPVVKGDWSEYYKNIADCLAGKAEPIVTPEQALRVMAVVDAIFESDKKGVGIKTFI